MAKALRCWPNWIVPSCAHKTLNIAHTGQWEAWFPIVSHHCIRAVFSACRRATSRKILSEASRKSLEKYSRKVECLFLSLNARPSLSTSIKVLHNPLALFGPLRYNSLVRLRLVSLKSCRPRPVNFLSKNIEHMSSSEHDECLLTSAADRLS